MLKKILVITCGGTLAKTYSESDAVLKNVAPISQQVISELRLPDRAIVYVDLMHKDSLDMDDADRAKVVECIKASIAEDTFDGILIIHGTDTLSVTGESIYQAFPALTLPIVITGSMRPYIIKGSDALQNIAESLFAFNFIAPGVYVVMHGRICQFPGVVKNKEEMTFEHA